MDLPTDDGDQGIFFPDVDHVLTAHAAALGISRDEAVVRLGGKRALLEGALARPRMNALYQPDLGSDIAYLGAVLGRAISEAQAFIDGNKRTAHETLHAFLIINGYECSATPDQYFAWILRMATGEDAQTIAVELREFLVPVAFE